MYVCFRVNDLMANGFSRYVVDPDKNLTYDIVQSYVNEKVPEIPTPLLCNWKDNLVCIPEKLNYTHVYEYLIKRTVVVLTKERDIVETYDLPVADKPLTKGYNFYGSGHVSEIKVNLSDQYCHVWSHVMASMRDESYLTKTVLDAKSSCILKAECACVAGRGGKCNHIAAVLFALVEYRDSQMKISCTGKPQQWHLPSRSRKRKTKPQKIGE